MKKLIAVLAACLMAPIFAGAQGIEDGDHMFSMMLGAGAGLQDSGFQWGNEDVEWGKAGVVAGLSYMVFPSKFLGVGVEVNDGLFADDKHSAWVMGNHYEMINGMNVLNAMASFRFNFNPDSRCRIYVPFGAGLSSATGVIEQKTNGNKHSETATYNSLGWFAGVGLEIALGSSGRWALGAEGRYNAFQFDTDKLLNKWGAAGVGKKDYSYLSAMFKASYRF